MFIKKAIDNRVNKCKSFSDSDLISSFPWMNKDLAKEEIEFWLENNFIKQEGYTYFSLNKQAERKAIFLDIDGVLNHSKSKDAIDDKCLANLKRIVEATGALIVLVSSWKSGWFKNDKEAQDDDANYLDEKFKEVSLEIYDKSSKYCGCRAIEVVDWVMKLNLSKFVIIDDDSFNYRETYLENYYFETSYSRGGLILEIADAIIKFLENKSFIES